MKKVILGIVLIASLIVSQVIASNYVPSESNMSTSMTQSREVRVTKIDVRGANMAVRGYLNGTFDPDNMTVNIKGSSYSVSSNNLTGHGRENFSYVAAGIYFFN